MKKIVSLVLALLMLSALSITAAAADSAVTPATLSDIIGYYLGSAQNPKAEITTRWVGYCPKDDCDGEAIYYVVNGGIEWICAKCNRSGSYFTGSAPSVPTYSHTTPVCSFCGESRYLRYLETLNWDHKNYDEYFCTTCSRLVYVTADDTAWYSGYTDTVPCKADKCGKLASLSNI